MHRVFTIIPQFLKDPQAFYQSVQNNEDLRPKAISLFVSTVAFLMIYGFVTGLSHGWLQACSTAIKIPLLFLLTLVFTLPALYFFALALLNIRFSVVQAGVVVLSGLGVSAFLLLGLSPVTLFFVLTSTSYPFFQLLAVVFVAISGITGLSYILRGFAWIDRNHEFSGSSAGNALLRAWVVVYGFVGTQMTWRLSPLVGDPQQPFVILQPSRDNFVVDVLNAVRQSLGMTSGAGVDIVGLLFYGSIMLGMLIAIGVWLVSRQRAAPLPAPPQAAPQ